MFGDNMHITESVCNIIDNAPLVKAFTEEDMAGAYNEGYACGSREYARPQGEWKYTHDTFSKRICDKCNYSQVIVDGMADNFCPNCGADMQKGGEEE